MSNLSYSSNLFLPRISPKKEQSVEKPFKQTMKFVEPLSPISPKLTLTNMKERKTQVASNTSNFSTLPKIRFETSANFDTTGYHLSNRIDKSKLNTRNEVAKRRTEYNNKSNRTIIKLENTRYQNKFKIGKH